MSKPFHITIPDLNQLHVLQGYQEIIDSLLWGLRELGYDASYSPDSFRPGARHIIFRGDAARIPLLKELPADTIFYNLEQSYRLFTNSSDAEQHPPLIESFTYIKQNFELWDYSTKNIEAMSSIPSTKPNKYVPIGFAPIWECIKNQENQDIDVLIYGMPHDYRLEVFKALCQMGLKCLFLCGFYGAARDELIGRAKIILNLSSGETESIFPVVRASYLLANRKLVLADFQPHLHYEIDMARAVLFCATENIPLACKHILDNDSERRQIEENGYNIISCRNIRDILRRALE